MSFSQVISVIHIISLFLGAKLYIQNPTENWSFLEVRGTSKLLFLASLQIPWRKQRQENVSDNYNLFSSTKLWGCQLSNHFSTNISMDKVARVYVRVMLQGKRHHPLSLMAYKNNTIIAIIDPFNEYYVPSTVLSHSFIHLYIHQCVRKNCYMPGFI